MDVVKAVDDVTNMLIANDVMVSQLNFNGTVGEKYYKQKFEK